jgi:hypothetical protein
MDAPGYSYNPYVDDGATQPLSTFCINIGGCFPHVNCATVDWAVLLVNAAPDSRPVGPANWQAVTGAADVSGNLTPGTAPDITVSPSSGTLASGAQVLIHVTGSYTGGRLFAVHFVDPQSPVFTVLELKCQV